MPRNGSGTYNLPASTSFNPATTGQNATAADWNALASDLATALSASIAADGQTTVTQNIPLNGNRLTGVGAPSASTDAATKGYVDASQRSYLAGLTLSNDSGTPNSVLDIAAGFSVDSTNTVGMSSGAFTKSTGGSWTVGTGQNGMGQGLTITTSTWYHVFQIVNTGSVDFYFDTSASAANKPTGTTAFRRIGSFLTDGSAHIVAFVQVGDHIYWKTPVQSYSATGTGATVALTVPSGVNVKAIFSILGTLGSPGARNILAYPTFINAQTPNSPTGNTHVTWGTADQQGAALVEVMTDTSQSIVITADNTTTLSAVTMGWIDRRGRDA